MPSIRPGFSVTRLTQLDVVLNTQNKIVGVVNADGSVTQISPEYEPLDADYVLTTEDDNKKFYCTTALTITWTAGMRRRPDVVVLPPPSGNFTLLPSGGATANGATSPVIRTRTTNPCGVAITGNPDSDGCGVSGS